MTEKEQPEVLDFPLLVLNKLGLYSTVKSKKFLLIRSFYIFALIFIEIVASMQFLNIENDVFGFVFNLQAVNSFANLLGKVIVIHQRQTDFCKLLNATKLFWKTQYCSRNTRISVDRIILFNLRLQRYFFICIGASTVAILLSPVLGNSLPTGIWTMDGYDFLYKTLLGTELAILPAMCLFTYAFECVYLAFCFKLIVQFKILGHSLEKLSVSTVNAQITEQEFYGIMKRYIRYHIFLLRFSKTLRNFYSPVIFVECISMMPLICALTYALFESNEPQIFFRHFMVYVSVVLDLALYCIPADYVSSTAFGVSYATYNSDWYSKYFSTLRKPLTLMIQRSQQEFALTALGLFDINAQTLLTIMRWSYSAAAVIRASKSNV